MSEAKVLLERDHDVATLTLQHAERRNAMTREMGEAFAQQVSELAKDASLRALILTGAPEGRAFSAGGDLGMIGAHADRGAEQPGQVREEARATMRSFYELFLCVRDLPYPSIAAINGHAIGAGLCITLACDLRIASRQAKLAFNFTQLGIHPGMGASWLLPRLLGPARAADLLFSGRTLLGEEAEAIGLVNRAVDSDAVLKEAQILAGQIAAAAPLAVRGVKQALQQSAKATLAEQLDFEAARQAECYETEDMQEGLAAMRERRPPHFKGR